MSNYNWCHGPNCHTIQTQSRVRGSGENKVLRTIKVKVHDYSNHHWFQGWENHFCKVTCFFDYMKIHWQEIVRIAPRREALETPIKVEKEKYESYKHEWNGDGRAERVPYMATRTTINSVDND